MVLATSFSIFMGLKVENVREKRWLVSAHSVSGAGGGRTHTTAWLSEAPEISRYPVDRDRLHQGMKNNIEIITII